MNMTSRRKFIKRLSQLGIGLGFIDTLFDQVIIGVLSDAYANNALNENNYLGINFAGGYPRWMFDLPINQAVGTTPGDLNYNPMIFTKLSIDTATNPPSFTGTYALDGGLPPLWGDTNLSTLKSAMTIIRGMDNLAIHPAWVKQYKPRNDKIAIHATLAHNGAKNFFPNMSVNMPNVPLGLQSGENSSLIKFDSENSVGMIEQITEIFQSDKIAESTINDKVETALLKLRNLGEKYNVNSNQMSESLQKARELLMLSLDNLSTKFEERFEVYKTKWSTGIAKQISGLDDTPIPTNVTEVTFDGVTNTNFFAGLFGGHNGDLRNLVIHETTGKQATNLSLCASLAFSEIMLGLHGDVKFTNSLFIDSGVMIAANGSRLGGDPHNIGAIPQGYLFTKYFQGFAYCLNEFVTTLDNKGKLNKTLIHLGSEFSRSARADGGGSDHGGRAGIATIFTKLKNNLPQIVGELAETGDTSGTWIGHWGQNASGYKDQDVFNFIEHLLGVPANQRTFPEKKKVINDAGGES